MDIERSRDPTLICRAQLDQHTGIFKHACKTLPHVPCSECLLGSPPYVVLYELRCELAYQGGSRMLSHTGLL